MEVSYKVPARVRPHSNLRRNGDSLELSTLLNEVITDLAEYHHRKECKLVVCSKDTRNANELEGDAGRIRSTNDADRGTTIGVNFSYRDCQSFTRFLHRSLLVQSPSHRTYVLGHGDQKSFQIFRILNEVLLRYDACKSFDREITTTGRSEDQDVSLRQRTYVLLRWS